MCPVSSSLVSFLSFLFCFSGKRCEVSPRLFEPHLCLLLIRERNFFFFFQTREQTDRDRNFEVTKLGLVVGLGRQTGSHIRMCSYRIFQKKLTQFRPFPISRCSRYVA